MLQSLRRASQSYVAKVLFGVLLLSFALWGMGPIFSGSRVSAVAEAGDVTITRPILELAYKREIERIQQQFGYDISPEQAEQLGLKLQVLRRLILETLYDQEAYAQGIILGQEEIRQTIASQPNLRDEDGNFSPAQFQRLLQIVGMNEEDYILALQRDVTRTVLMGAVRSGARVPEVLAAQMYAYAEENRLVDGLFIEAADMDVAEPSEEDLRSYYEANQEDYRAPEYRKMDYVVIDVSELKEKISPEEETLKAAYEAAPDQYGLPERRDLIQVTTNNEELARAIAADAQASGSLSEAAEKHGQKAAAANDLTKSTLLPQVADRVFSLEEGVPSGAFKSSVGWLVVEVTDIVPPVDRSYAEVREQVLEQVKLAKANDLAEEMVLSLEDLIAEGSSVAEAAEELDLTVEQVGPVSLQGQTPEGTMISGGMLLAEILQTGFQLGFEHVSQVQPTSGGQHYAVQTMQIMESQIRSFETVKDEVRTAWMDQQKLEKARERASALAEGLRAGEEPAGLKQLGPFDRQGILQANGKVGLERHVLESTFAQKEGSVLTAETEKGSWVLRVAEIVPASEEGVDIDSIQKIMRSGQANDILDQHSRALREEYEVTIHEEAL